MKTIEMIEKEIIDAVKVKGDYDGTSHILFLGLNDEINIEKYTDILAAYVGTDGLLSFIISDRDDTIQTFVSISTFSPDTILKIQKQIFLA